MTNNLVFGVDMDGTIVDHAFPEIGSPLPHAVEVLKKLKKAGHKLILWTAREDVPGKHNKQYLTDAVDWCRKQGIEFDAVNDTPIELDWRQDGGLRRKIHVDCFIDDRNFGGFPGWEAIGRHFLGDQVMEEVLKQN